ncbi:hypothetical protein [Streptomyces sp. NBC_01198]|uniref:hypothetical protein n=1 Tax=Streptomyces sp. NBC_01198 TaxID=2903769 RepID=UPI002E0E7EE8|nr:hypothetical protein OG702_31615 [Streptomyces sp. NBC_01198]
MAAAESTGDDELFVLTAAMLTPERFPGVLGDDYPAACAYLGLDPLPYGYGLMFGQDGGGARWTVATTDAAMVACALAAWDCGLEYELSPEDDTLAASLPGWPLPVAVSVPGIPGPHDPADEEAGPALAPPDVSVWGPPQRRMGADEIAIRWFEWRDQLLPADAPEADSPDSAAKARTGAAGAHDRTTRGAAKEGREARAGTADTDAAAAPAPPVAHAGLRRALQGAEEYLRTPPPPGRVRTTAGSLRADGPGWSLVARTDDVAFVLLDEAPGEVLPVGRGPALPPLLEALDKLASAAS